MGQSLTQKMGVRQCQRVFMERDVVEEARALMRRGGVLESVGINGRGAYSYNECMSSWAIHREARPQGGGGFVKLFRLLLCFFLFLLHGPLFCTDVL